MNGSHVLNTVKNTRDVYTLHEGEMQMPATTPMLQVAQHWTDTWSMRYDGTDVTKLWAFVAVIDCQPTDPVSWVRQWESILGKRILPDPAERRHENRPTRLLNHANEMR